MKEILCPKCNRRADHYLDLADHFLTKESFELYHCVNCHFLFTYPVPQDLSPYYDSQEYLSHHTEKKNLKTFLYNKVRDYQLRQKLNLIRSLSPGKRLLDYGCGSGLFLYYCLQQGYDCFGIEPDQDARISASELTGLNIYENHDFITHESPFNIITLWHVLEHIPSPWDLLTKLKRALHQHGILIIAVPNFKSADALHYQSYWAGYDVPRHLYHFSQEAISTLANDCGYTVAQVKPMIFDSFYVSLLSEQYKKRGIFSYPSALIQGLNSNISATKTGEYSSLIYVLKKDE